MATLDFVSSAAGTGLFYAFLAGIALFVTGIIWLVWISAFTQKEYSNDGKSMADKVSIATLLCLAGIIIFAVSGCMMAAV